MLCTVCFSLVPHCNEEVIEEFYRSLLQIQAANYHCNALKTSKFHHLFLINLKRTQCSTNASASGGNLQWLAARKKAKLCLITLMNHTSESSFSFISWQPVFSPRLSLLRHTLYACQPLLQPAIHKPPPSRMLLCGFASFWRSSRNITCEKL